MILINEFAYTKLLLPVGPIPHNMAETVLVEYNYRPRHLKDFKNQ